MPATGTPEPGGGVAHGLEHPAGAVAIDGEKLGVTPGRREPGHVVHDIGAFHRAAKCARIVQITLYDLGLSFREDSGSLGEIADQCDDVVSAREQGLGEVRSHEPGRAGNEVPHSARSYIRSVL